MKIKHLNFIYIEATWNKTEETTGDLIGNKISDKITKVLRDLPQNDSETVESERKTL